MSRRCAPYPTRFNYNRADWRKYQNIIDRAIIQNSFNHFHTPKDIEIGIVYVANSIQRARQESIPIYQRSFETKLTEKGDSFWETLLYELRESHGNVTLQNVERLIPCTFSSISPIDQVKSNYVSDNKDRDIAYRLADVFKEAHETTLSWTHPTDALVTNRLYSYPNINRPTFYIKCRDIKNVIEELKPIKSSGPDDIQNILLVNLPDTAIERLRRIFNACIALSYWPSYFKAAKIIPILKSGKDPSEASSYRPISLTNSIGKIFEKLVKEEIEKFVMKKEIIPPQQFGFRKKHSPMMQAKRITCFIACNKNRLKTVGLVKLDVEKASDSVWHDGLIYKLKEKFNFPQTLWKLIDSFIRDREFIVYVKGSKSYKVKMSAGLAQGTVLNPLLYILYVSDIPIPVNVQLAMYADDIAIYTSSYDPDAVVRNLNNALNVLRKYFVQWKIKINIDKLQAIIFPTKRHQEQPSIAIVYENEIVQLENSIKYLGITLDEMLTFEEHLNVVMDKAIIYFKKFSPLLTSSRMSIKTKLLLYTTIIRPIMAHGSPIFTRASPIILNKLYILQLQFLKLILNLPSTIQNATIEKHYRIPQLSRYLDRINQRFTKKCEGSEYELIKDIDHECLVITALYKN